MEDVNLNTLVRWVYKNSKQPMRQVLSVILLEHGLSSLICEMTGINPSDAEELQKVYQSKGILGITQAKVQNYDECTEALDSIEIGKQSQVEIIVPEGSSNSIEAIKVSEAIEQTSKATNELQDNQFSSSDEKLVKEQNMVSHESQTQSLIGEPMDVGNIESISINDSGVTGAWQNIEPKDDDQVANTSSDYKEGELGWKVIGASCRGKYHAHNGTFREDAFSIETIEGWNVVAVADGAGSAPLARVGASVAVKSVIESFKNAIKAQEPGENVSLPLILKTCLESAYDDITKEAKLRQRNLNELATTLLVLAHKHDEQQDEVGVAQIGDGMIVAWPHQDEMQELATPDQGRFAGETQFLTHLPKSELSDRIHIIENLPEHVQYFLVMTDGIADDFFPPKTYLHKLIDPIKEILMGSQDEMKQNLLRLIGYEKRASFDDRTLVILYQSLPEY